VNKYQLLAVLYLFELFPVPFFSPEISYNNIVI
jgi:hypothetical protein